METLRIHGIKYMLPGKLRGHMKDKWNRAAKLMGNFEELDRKFRGMVERGGFSDHGRAALACLLMMHTGIRVGNEDSAEGYMTKPHPNNPKPPEFVKTYGLTTLLIEHVTVKEVGGSPVVIFNFVGKKQVENSFEVVDKFIAGRVKMLTQRKDALTLFDLSDYALTRFVKKYVGSDFSPKDFRTMRAHMYASEFISRNFQPKYEKKKDLKAHLKDLFIYVSQKLNNLPGTCKKSYITDQWPVYIEKTRLKPKTARK